MTTIAGGPVTGTPCWNDLMVADAAAAARFYATLFDWSYDVSGPEYGFYHMAKLGGRSVAGIGQLPPEGGMPSAWTTYFAADDVKAMARRAAKLGGKVVVEPMEVPQQGWMALILDPTGATFGLWQGTGHLGAEAREGAGTVNWRDLQTGDLASASAFDTGLLGLEARALDGGASAYTVLVKNGKDVCGIAQMPGGGHGMPAQWLTYFEVKDLDASIAAAKKVGGKVVQRPFDMPFGRMAVLTDPYGATFSLNWIRARTGKTN